MWLMPTRRGLLPSVWLVSLISPFSWSWSLPSAPIIVLSGIGGDRMSVDLIIDGAVAKVVLNRPEKLNALNVEMRESLCDHFARLRYDDAVRVVIVTGAGRGFCSGADVDRMAGQHHDLRGGRQRLQQGGHTFIRALHAIEKPVIAAVRGPAVGIGWSIALACDLVVA